MWRCLENKWNQNDIFGRSKNKSILSAEEAVAVAVAVSVGVAVPVAVAVAVAVVQDYTYLPIPKADSFKRIFQEQIRF
jgi:hypothetical protein